MLKTEAIQKFLSQQSYPMCKFYTPEMEVQINVAKDEGETITGLFAGHRWYGFTDGQQTWKHFRIPFGANTNPTYLDKPIAYDISKHAEAIGLTGWNWVTKQSLWVGFDFDSIVNHKEGLTSNELKEILEKISAISFVHIITSTSGSGYHIYVYTNVDNVTNHTEHAAIAKAILSKLSALTGINLETKVDSYGGILWIWHRKATIEKSFKLIKQHTEIITENDIINWREFLDRVTKTKLIHSNVDEIIAAKRRLNLDDTHIKLLKWFENSDSLWWWNDDKQMLVCHTSDLKRAHTELKFKGLFDTISTGTNRGNDQNCFGFPLNDGGWIFRRHTKDIIEHILWFKDNSNWTTTYFNYLPTLKVASKIVEGIEGEKEYLFKSLSKAVEALKYMGINCPIDNIPQIESRPATIQEKDGKIILSFLKFDFEVLPNFIGHKKNWIQIFLIPYVNTELELPDNIIRHLVSLKIEAGWFVYTNSGWVNENSQNVQLYLSTFNKKKNVLGNCIAHNWVLVNKPFQPEYPGNREWNMKAAQFRYNAKSGSHKTWDKIISHCGTPLDKLLASNNWCQENGIYNGLIYLQCWLASCLQSPEISTPYLFLYSPEESTGKSIFHEALSLLFSKGTVVRADHSLINQQGFNGELLGAVFCIIEETNLARKNIASDKIKDWVTGKTITIRQMYKQPYDITNNTHWIQCANDPTYCPIFPGDTRIMVIRVPVLDKEEPKDFLLKECEKEAEAFLYTLMNFELPEITGRMRPPVITTEEKEKIIQINYSDLQTFVQEKVLEIPGQKILVSEFYEKFNEWLDPQERQNWTLRLVARQAPFLKGKHGDQNKTYFGNISWEKTIAEIPYRLSNGRLCK